MLIVNFFSLNFIIIETEEERVSSGQNERTLEGGRGGGWSKTNKGEQRGRGRSQNSGMLSERTF